VNDPVKLTDRQSMILQMLYEDKTLSRERLCAKAGLSDATAKREMAYLKRIGMLKRVGSDKNGYWLVGK
ncbi:MAG: DeoR family transcriptional regulator, partial [Prevotellaceae bacterium]|nr:DeoR family transcriptional regulator [Prevotellaceae bacterium]